MPAVKNLRTNITSYNASKAPTVGEYMQKASAPETSQVDDFAGRFTRHVRNSWLVTCVDWVINNKPAIELYVNPASVSWSIPRRGSFSKTAAGTIRNVWRNRYRGTYFDEFEIQVAFQGGNCMPFMGHADVPVTMDNVANMVANPKVPPGIANLYRFMSLLNQPAMGGNNRHIIMYHSRIFPRMEFQGFFKDDAPVTWTETADDGNTINWNATFVVYETYPRIDSEEQLMAVYKGWIADEGMVEAVPFDRSYRDDSVFAEGLPTPFGEEYYKQFKPGSQEQYNASTSALLSLLGPQPPQEPGTKVESK